MTEQQSGYSDAPISSLNPDITIVNPEAIPGMLENMCSDPGVACSLPMLLSPTGQVRRSCRQFYTARSLAVTRIARMFGRSDRMRKHHYLDADRSGFGCSPSARGRAVAVGCSAVFVRNSRSDRSLHRIEQLSLDGLRLPLSGRGCRPGRSASRAVSRFGAHPVCERGRRRAGRSDDLRGDDA